MARFAHQLAVENSLVTADVIEVSEFPELTHRYGLMSVPKIIVNETVSFEGSVPESHFLAKVLEAAGLGLSELRTPT